MRDPALYRFLPQAPPGDVEALAATLRRWTGGPPSPRERWWNWIVRATGSPGEPIVGHVQLTFTLASDVLVAYVFDPGVRGQGFATDATRCALAHVAGRLPTSEAIAVAFVDTANDRSIALAERLGMRRISPHTSVGTISPNELRFERPLVDFAPPTPGAPERAPSATIRVAAPAEREAVRAYVHAMYVEMGTPHDQFFDDWEARYDRRVQELERDAALRIIVAERDGEPVGTISVHVHESSSARVVRRRVAYLWGLYVAPEARGAGVARALVQASLDHARTLRCTRALLHASKMGRPLYDRLGFRPSTEMLLDLE